VETKNKQASSKPEKLVEDVDYYFENGLMVLTAHFLKSAAIAAATIVVIVRIKKWK
jgi:hypothetical protein